MKSIFSMLCGLGMATNLLVAEDAQLVDENFLVRLRAEASQHHPSAQSARLKASAAESDIRAIRLWDDPMVGLSLRAAERDMRRSDGDVRLSYEQPLPKPGIYSATQTKAESLSRAAGENSRMSLLRIAATAAKDVIELALMDESIILLDGQLQWLGKIAENAKQLSLNPNSNSIDSLRLESELARETQILAAARRSRESMAHRLNLRLGRPLETTWPALRLRTSPAPTPLANSEIARLSRVNPELRSLREMVTAASAEREIAQRSRAPQFSVGVDTDLYSGGDFRSASVGIKMSLPAFNRSAYLADIQAAQLREKAATKEVESARLEIAAEVLAASTAAANAAAQAAAYSGDIYQRSLAAAEAIENSWISSKSTLSDLLDAKRQLFSIRLEQRRFIAQQLAALEELNFLVPRTP